MGRELTADEQAAVEQRRATLRAKELERAQDRVVRFYSRVMREALKDHKDHTLLNCGEAQVIRGLIKDAAAVLTPREQRITGAGGGPVQYQIIDSFQVEEPPEVEEATEEKDEDYD